MAKTNILLTTGTNELEIIEFIIDYIDGFQKIQHQSFAINVAKIREIIRIPKLTKMPQMHKCIQGMFNIRGNVIPAIDLSLFLYNRKSDLSNYKTIIAEFNNIQCGLIVKDVNRIHRISWSDILSPDTLQEFNPTNTTITGIIKLEDRNILMLDVEKIISDIDPSMAMENVDVGQTLDWKPKVITVEDSVVIRNMMTSKLKSAGFEIEAFNDGQAAWERLEEISKEIANGGDISQLLNVVITDIEMPKMDGYTLTKHIKSDPNLSKTPVILFSSLINDEIIHKGESVGADFQLTKPQLGELISVINSLLDKK